MWDRVPRKGILTPTQGSPLGRDRWQDCHHAGGHREGPHEPNILRRERGCEPLRAFAGGRGRGWVGSGLSGDSRGSEELSGGEAVDPEDLPRRATPDISIIPHRPTEKGTDRTREKGDRKLKREKTRAKIVKEKARSS